ncbi:MAG: amino acid--tRNA ligase-related protein, partial [Candidatus Woesearchaeota archaeon]
MKRTHTCGDLRKENIGNTVTLSGWVNTRRDHGGLIFIDLRDRYGLSQVVFEPTHSKKIFSEAENLRREDVIEVTGKVRSRPEGMINPKLPTGDVEVLIDELEVLSKADTPPIEIDDRKVANEELRLKYRYLDLRRPEMQKNLLTRHKVAQAAREFLSSQDFIEVETPILVRSTPEGARDYVVPSRVHPGEAYALPQSPQLYKQILMVSGCDRYFQLARCLRD